MFDNDFDYITTCNDIDDFVEPETWTIVSALNRVLSLALDSSLSQEFWEQCKNPLDFLTKQLNMTNIQVVVLALLVEQGEAMSWRAIAKALKCSRLSVMTYTDEIEDLVKQRWLTHRSVREMGTMLRGFALSQGVVKALCHNKKFIPERIDGLDLNKFVFKVANYIKENFDDDDTQLEDNEEWLQMICEANSELPLCREVLRFADDSHVQSLLLMAVSDYVLWGNSNQEGLELSAIEDIYSEECDSNYIIKQLQEGTHVLLKGGYIGYVCDDGIADNTKFVLTQRFKDELLPDVTPRTRKINRRPMNDLKKHTLIKEKDMFYNVAEKEQIERLTNLLSQDRLQEVQARLEEQGMRKGFACLFYGAPGTGKTETVLQIARRTGRDIMQVDIAGMRDKFMGESEKNIKAVFHRYREICRQKEVMPILFFNEADALINKRTENIERSVEKMDNAMQNIILQELEDLDGILIATTNLTSNLDDAFERRFLFKVEFKQPEVPVKQKLWCSMMHDISEEEALILARKYDFSGGQIENIARKRTIDYIISGKHPSFEELENFCKAEMLNKAKNRTAIGFR